MDRFLQLLVLAALATSSYTYPQKMPQLDAEIPIELEENKEYFYPAEYINKLLTKYSPEELEALRSATIDVGQREGDFDTTCNSYIHKYIPLKAQNEFGVEYYIIAQNVSESITVQICNFTLGNNCSKYQKLESRSCCLAEKGQHKFNVLSVSVDDYLKRDPKENECPGDSIVPMTLYVDTKCSCKEQMLDYYTLNGECKNTLFS